MYGIIGSMRASPGERANLASILLEGTADMPGCLSYVVSEDPDDADLLWITEVWRSEADHRASLELPAVREAITRGRPLIVGFEHRTVTRPIGGHGIPTGTGA